MFKSSEDIPSKYSHRRESVFLILAGLFLGSLTMLNILGVSRIIDFSIVSENGNIDIPFKVTIGVLPYPITFLCTDLISELYGRKLANKVVWVGLLLNLWVLFILWLGGTLPPQPPVNPETGLPPMEHKDYVFYTIRELTFATTIASMIAYLTAQFCDVHIFHFLKKLTKGKHLWLRNNGSTLISQLVDSFAVIMIAHFLADAFHLKGQADWVEGLLVLIFSGYVFKLTVALLDTVPFYLGTSFLTSYLRIDPNEEFNK